MPGDRLVRGAAELVGDQRDALALGEALELADQVAQVVGARHLLVRVGAGIVQDRGVELEVGRAQRAPQNVEGAVAHDREEPWLQRHLAAVGAQRGQRAHEGVLHDLLGVVVRAAEHLARVADQPLLVAGVDGVEGPIVALAHEVDELLVGGGAVGGRVKEDRHDPRIGAGGTRSHPPEGHTWPPEVGHPSPWVALTIDMASPLQAHSATPAELRDRIEAERRGRPFLVFRDGDGAQRLLDLASLERVSVGRGSGNELSLPWDTEVSRLHAELEAIAGEWTVSDDGLSRNGTYVNGARISGRTRLRDGDVLRVGQTSMAFRRPESEDSLPTQIAGQRLTLGDLPPTQRQVLVALSRPYKHDEFAVPATNQDIADELHLSVDAVKSHLRTLFQRFGIEHLPQNQKRSRLVAEALQAGVVSTRDL